MLTLLTECTVLMLKVIHEMYWKQRITYDEFLSYSEVKIKFLLENIDNITSEAERRTACDIIDKCTSLITQKNGSEMINLYSFHSSTLQ